jgi:CDP-diacylglycerol pyrophosphatase
MMVFAVAFVLTALVVAVLLVSVIFRDAAYCPRRETLVDIVQGRCAFRATTCANAPLGCERECIKLSNFTARAY